MLQHINLSIKPTDGRERQKQVILVKSNEKAMKKRKKTKQMPQEINLTPKTTSKMILHMHPIIYVTIQSISHNKLIR